MTQDNDINALQLRRSELFAAIAKSLFETKDIAPDSNNPFHKAKYASLSAHLNYIKPIFAKNGLGILQFPTSASDSFWSGAERKNIGAVGIKTIIIHKNGESIEESCVIPIDTDTTGQQAGALLTYLRRYALASVAGVATEDDDAEFDRQVKTVAPKQYVAPKPVANYITGLTAPEPASGDIDPSIPVPFGNNKGTPIGELGGNDLAYWATKWEPRPYEKTGRVTAKDAKLKATAVALYSNSQGPQQEPETSDEVPF
jgi:hypothetical protein